MALLCAFSCEKHEAEMSISTFIVSGTVYGADTGEPLNNISVSLLGYSQDDSRMESTPVDSKASRTDSDGRYKITLFEPQAQKYFKVVAYDLSGDEDAYQSAMKVLYVGDGTAYHDRGKTYELEGIDFYLKK